MSLPNSPASIAAFIQRSCGVNRISKSTARFTPVFAAALIILSHRLSVTSIGLVVMTCLPFFAAAMAKSACVPEGVMTMTTSRSLRRSIFLNSVYPSQPNSVDDFLRRSSLRSQTATSLAPSVLTMVFARSWPMPRPTIPNPMGDIEGTMLMVKGFTNSVAAREHHGFPGRKQPDCDRDEQDGHDIDDFDHGIDGWTGGVLVGIAHGDRKSTRLNSSPVSES